jgi:hypothetical protein
MNSTVRFFCPEGKIPYIYMDLRIGMKVNRKKQNTGRSWNPAPIDKSVLIHLLNK